MNSKKGKENSIEEVGSGRRGIGLKLSFVKNRRSSSYRQSSMTPTRKIDETITINSSSDMDVINASVQDISDSFDWIRTPRTTKFPLNPISTPLNPINFNSRTTTPRPAEAASTKIEDVPQKVLECSRRRNVEQWLFSSSTQKNVAPSFVLSPPREVAGRRDSSSSIDPEVRDVLLAVYGDDWENKCSTEDKKTRRNSHIKLIKTVPKTKCKSHLTEGEINPSTTAIPTLAKKRKGCEGGESVKRSKVVRRNIFSSDDNLCSKNGENLISSPAPISPSHVVLKKITAPIKRRLLSTPTVSASPCTIRTPNSEKCTPRRTFLGSLSVSSPTSISHPEAQIYKLHFNTKKEELCARLFKLYNSEVFGNALPEDMQISWNPRMRRTAGYCFNKRTSRGNSLIRTARIELGTRIVDRADRLRDTLVHELCHAATWIIDGVKDGHGPVWLKWAHCVAQRFPELPIIKRCHNYEIAAKYTYRCSNCGYSFNRQSKSIDLDRKRCGHCGGILELLVNKKKRGQTEVPEFDTTKTIKPPNAFALFVKEHYKRLKKACPDKKHGEIMKLLSRQYAIYKSVLTPGKS